MHQVLNRQRNLILSLKVLFIPFPHTNRLSEAERLQTVNITLFFRFHISLRPVEEKAMAPYSSTLARKIPWTEKLGRLQSMASLRVDMTERLHSCFSLSCIGERNGNPLQCSCLENPRDEGAWWAAVYGVAQSWTGLKRLSGSSSKPCLVNYFYFFATSIFSNK